ncbi:MAG: hypothetical protein WC616_01600 [Candidatus Omnitrophota bacterium]
MDTTIIIYILSGVILIQAIWHSVERQGLLDRIMDAHYIERKMFRGRKPEKPKPETFHEVEL